MIQKLLFIGLSASLFFCSCGGSGASSNGGGEEADTVSVESVGQLQDMKGSWAPASFFENIEKTRSFTQNLNPKGIIVHEVGGKYTISPFTVEAGKEMELTQKPKKVGYAFDGTLAGMNAESYIKLVAGELVLTQASTETKYRPFESEEYTLLGGEYQAAATEAPESVEFKKGGEVVFANFVSYDLMTDSKNDILVLSSLPTEASFETYIGGAVWYLMEPSEAGFNLYEIKNYSTANFDLTGSKDLSKIETIAEKGELKYTLTKQR